MPDLKRQMLVCPVVAIYPTTACCLCVLSLLHKVLITRTYECYQANNMNFIYTITIMLIFISQVVSRNTNTISSPTSTFTVLLPAQLVQDRKSGKISWKYYFYPMHSCASCNSYWRSFLSLNVFPHICISDLYYRWLSLHFASHQVPTLTVDIWARQEKQEVRGETKMKCECISSTPKLESGSTESLAAQFWSQNYPETSGSSEDGSLFWPTGTNHTCSIQSATL